MARRAKRCSFYRNGRNHYEVRGNEKRSYESGYRIQKLGRGSYLAVKGHGVSVGGEFKTLSAAKRWVCARVRKGK